jgi:hypothetical protein
MVWKMLTDPLSVTYNGSAKTLPVVTGSTRIDLDRLLGSRKYATADGEFTVATRQGVRRDGVLQGEIHLIRKALETDVNTAFSGYFSNSVGLVYGIDPIRANTSVDIPLIRAALLSLVDSSLEAKILGGQH